MRNPENLSKIDSGDSTSQKKESDYFGTTRSELDHYYGNNILTLRILFQLKEENPNETINPEDCKKSLTKFADGLRKTLGNLQAGSIRLHKSVSEDTVKEFIELAEKVEDPSDESEINKIVERYESIRNPEASESS